MTDLADGAAPRRARGGTAPTIYDVARAAGVNPSTVSRALSRPERVSTATAQRIREAAAELEFHLNPTARALQTGRTNTLALMIGDITNPVVFDIIRGATAEAAQYGCTLIVTDSEESSTREAADARRLIPAVDGLILAITRLADEQIHDLARRKPLVVVNRDVGDRAASVLADLDPGIGAAVEHLAELGHRRLAYVPGPVVSWISGQRLLAIERACARLGLDCEAVGPRRPTREGGAVALDEVLATGASAVLGYNDMMMLGLLEAAASRGVRVPEQLSVVGFDDIFGADFASPPLATVRMPLALAGRRAVRMVLGHERAGAPLPTEFVPRPSAGPVAA